MSARSKTIALSIAGVLGLALLVSGSMFVGNWLAYHDQPEVSTMQQQQQREDRFWEVYEQRLGLIGAEYADPAEAKAGSIECGYFLCSKLADGTDPAVLVSQGNQSIYTREETRVQMEIAVEFLCPDQDAS